MPQPAGWPRRGFEEVVRPHLEYLYALSVRLTGNHTDAEDLVQDALLRAFRGFARLRNHQQPRLWLTRVLTTAFYDRPHGSREHTAVNVDEAFDLFDTIVEKDRFPYSDRVHLDFLDLFDDTKVIEVLQRIHPSHRAALILAYVYAYKTREIAKITGAPLGRRRSWPRSARPTVRSSGHGAL